MGKPWVAGPSLTTRCFRVSIGCDGRGGALLCPVGTGGALQGRQMLARGRRARGFRHRDAVPGSGINGANDVVELALGEGPPGRVQRARCGHKATDARDDRRTRLRI